MIVIAVIIVVFVGYKLITGVASRRSSAGHSDGLSGDHTMQDTMHFPPGHAQTGAMYTSDSIQSEQMHTHTPLHTTINDSSSELWSGSDSSSFSSGSSSSSSDSSSTSSDSF